MTRINTHMNTIFQGKENSQITAPVEWMFNEFSLNDTSIYDDPKRIHLLEKYMYPLENIEPLQHLCPSPWVPPKGSIDPFFWCIYVAAKGEDEFQKIGTRFQNAELEEKQKVLEFIKSNPSRMKDSNHKVTKALIQEIMSELLSSKETTLNVAIALAIFYEVDIYLVKENKYILFSSVNEDEKDTEQIKKNVIVYQKDKIFSVELAPDQDQLDSIKRNCFFVECIKKSLKAAASYKLSCLEKIADKFNLDTKKYKIKKALYDELVLKCTW